MDMIDLGVKVEKCESIPECTEGDKKEERIDYPTLYIRGKKLIFPDDEVVELVIKAKKTGYHETEDSDGKKQYSCELEIHSIENPAPAAVEEMADELKLKKTLDRIMEKKSNPDYKEE